MTQAEDTPNTNNPAKGGLVSPSLTTRSGIVGLQGAVIFALSFSLVGYSITLSLFLGAIGGAALAFLIKSWQIQENDIAPLQVSFSDEEIYGLRKKNRYARQKRYLEMRNRYRTRRQQQSLVSFFFDTGVAPPLPVVTAQPSTQTQSQDNQAAREDNEET